MMNVTMLNGRLCDAPELRYSGAGVAYAYFTLAVERDYSSNGQKETDYIDCAGFKGQAEFISNNFEKGDGIIIEGRIETSTYEKDGQKRKQVRVSCKNVWFASAKKKGASGASGAPAAAAPAAVSGGSDEYDPFAEE